MFLNFVWPRRLACGILVPPTTLVPPAVEARSPTHWTARGVLKRTCIRTKMRQSSKVKTQETRGRHRTGEDLCSWSASEQRVCASQPEIAHSVSVHRREIVPNTSESADGARAKRWPQGERCRVVGQVLVRLQQQAPDQIGRASCRERV